MCFSDYAVLWPYMFASSLKKYMLFKRFELYFFVNTFILQACIILNKDYDKELMLQKMYI